jgi:hypothetical protein
MFIGFCLLSIEVSGELQDDNLGVVEDEGSRFFRSVWVRLSPHTLSYPTKNEIFSGAEYSVLHNREYPEVLSV